jgi:short-subunit dehydrogenase
MQKTALITGASLGIGYELAKLFSKDKYALVITARNKSKLESLATEFRALGSPQVTVVAKDLTSLEAPEELFAATEKAGIKVDVLVNNAGFGNRGAFSTTDLDEELDMMQCNVVALVHLTKLYLPGMVARKSGRILQVSSVAGFQAGPFMAVYYATKAFVTSFSEALYEELRGSGVTVTALCPGATSTGFADRAGLGNSKLFKARVMDAPTVARIGYEGLMAGKPIVVTGFRNWLMWQSQRLGPRSLVRGIVRKINSTE